MQQITAIFFRYRVLAVLLIGLLFATAGKAETLRLTLEGQLDDDGLSINEDFENAVFSGFFEIDLDKRLNNPAGIRFYEFTSWDIDVVSITTGSVIRFASNGEPDDTATVFLDRFNDTLNIAIDEDNSPSTRRRLSVRFDPDINFFPDSRFEDLLTEDLQQFVTEPGFFSGSLQFAVSQVSTSVLTASLEVNNEIATRHVDGNTRAIQTRRGPDGNNSCALFDNPCSSIQQAIDSAKPGDEIQIADGVYTEILQVDKPLTFSGASRAGTVIQAAANREDAADRTMTIAEDVAVQLSDLTIRHGNTGLNGGGLRSFGGDLLIERVTFTGNDADGQGAGLASGENVIVMNDVVFRDNGNSNTSQGGGARLGANFGLTDVTMANVVFESNIASAGGGLSLFNAQTEASDVAFIGNVSDDNGGGLSYLGSNSVDSTLALTNVVFVGNRADGDGGGMYTETRNTPYSVTNALFSGNLANLGGALRNNNLLNDGERILTNVTMSGNRAMGDGGRGGGIDNPIDMRLRNTIIWNNQDESGVGTAEANLRDRFRNAVVEVSNSLLQGYEPDEWPGSNNLDGTDSGNDPLFRVEVEPSDEPSLPGNLRLQQDSPVRDRGNNSFVAGVATDLDGEDRIFNGIVDLGPYEGTDVLFADGFEDSLF